MAGSVGIAQVYSCTRRTRYHMWEAQVNINQGFANSKYYGQDQYCSYTIVGCSRVGYYHSINWALLCSMIQDQNSTRLQGNSNNRIKSSLLLLCNQSPDNIGFGMVIIYNRIILLDRLRVRLGLSQQEYSTELADYWCNSS